MPGPNGTKPCKLPSRGESMVEYLADRRRRRAVVRAQARAQCIANALPKEQSIVHHGINAAKRVVRLGL